MTTSGQLSSFQHQPITIDEALLLQQSLSYSTVAEPSVDIGLINCQQSDGDQGVTNVEDYHGK